MRQSPPVSSAWDRPSVLAVASEIPWPLNSGGHLRTYHMLRALATRLSVRLIVPSTAAKLRDERAALADAGIDPRIVHVRRRTAVGEAARIIRAGLRREPYVLFARHRHLAVRDAIAREVNRRRPAVLYLDHLDSMLYGRAETDAAIVVDMHNVYSRLAARAAAETAGRLRRGYLNHEAHLLLQVERRAARLAHTVLAVSEEERSYFTGLGARRVVVVPNGVDCAAFDRAARTQRTGPPTILFVGSLSWPPNVSAARFLATEVLPRVHQRVPDARLSIVGKDPPPDLLALGAPDNRIVISANVANVEPYFREAHVLAVPLRAGGGTRLKILEAFAAGVPVVSTAVGCEGLGASDGDQIVVADESDFAAAIVRLLVEPGRASGLARQALPFVRARYDWSVVGERACEAVTFAASSNRSEQTLDPRFAATRSLLAP